MSATGGDRGPDEISRDPRGDLKSRETGAPAGIFRATDSGASQAKNDDITSEKYRRIPSDTFPFSFPISLFRGYENAVSYCQ